MTLLHNIRMLVRKAGIDVARYNPIQSEEARLARMLEYHEIDAVIDVGANNGGYGRLLRSLGYAGHILSFEPLSAEHARLLIAVSGDANWHVAPRCCLGDETKEIDINIAGNSASSSILPMTSAHEESAPTSRCIATERVSLRRLDDIQHRVIDESNSILLKVDTQGYELQVLNGARKLLDRVKGLQLELSAVELYRGQTLYREVIDWVERHGFDLWGLIPGFRDPSSGRMLQMDGIFFRERGLLSVEASGNDAPGTNERVRRHAEAQLKLDTRVLRD